MGIHRNGRHIINHAGHHIGGLLTHARQLHQGFNITGNGAIKALHQHVAGTQKIFSLGVIKATVPNLRLHLLLSQRSHLLRRI